MQSTLSGAGLAQLPVWLVKQYLDDGQLCPVLEKFNGEGAPISIVWLKTPYILPKIRVIIDEIITLTSRHPDVFEASL